jgi:ribokinase
VAQPALGDGPLVVVGSHVPGLLLHVDAVPREGETVLGWKFEEPEDGGKATNQAVAAAKLGAPVALVTLLGDDERGRRWHGILAGYGIDTRFVLEVPGATDIGFVLLPPSRIPAIASTLDRSLLLDAAAAENARDLLERASIVICQLEAPQSCAVASFRIARAVGALTLLNPAPAATLEPELLELTDLLVPNEHEAAALLGLEAPPGDLARLLSAQLDGRPVIVTAGAAGCYIAEGEGLRHVEATSAVVEDTTGAGDAFIGALAVRLRAGDSLSDAAQFAARAAAISVERPGTMPAFATSAEMSTASLAPS